MVRHFLPALRLPPFDGEVALAARNDDPIRDVPPQRGLHLSRAASLDFGQMNVSVESRRLDPHAQLLREILMKPVNILRGIEFSENSRWGTIGLCEQRNRATATVKKMKALT